MKIALIQMSSVLDPSQNLAKIRSFSSQIKEEKVDAIFLPEVFYSISDGSAPTPHLVEEGNQHFLEIVKLVRELNCYVLGGSVAYRKENHIINRCLNFSPNGQLLAYYDKIHLFSCDLSQHQSKQVIDESKLYQSGCDLKSLEIDQWKIGLAICFDLRFPEVFRHYYKESCHLVTVSSAFTKVTGQAHWHTLCRARAIENQMYVVATNQWGQHNEIVSTFGHSLVIDPWGEILADGGEGEKVIFADLNLDQVRQVRKRMNMSAKIKDYKRNP